MPEAPPRTLDDLNKIVQHNMTPDPSWEATGEFHTDSAGQKYPVWSETVPITKKRPSKDPDGNVLWHLRPDGSRHRPMMEEVTVGEETREFTVVPLGNGVTQKNYNFKPSPEEIAKREAEAAEKQAVSELGRALRESGQTFSDFVGGVKRKVGIEPREEAEEDEEEAVLSGVAEPSRGLKVEASSEDATREPSPAASEL